jgi:uncharacterized protein (UPF0332 family)
LSAAEFLAKAETALQSAKRDLAARDFDGAANRLYYAMFHAAKAALLRVGASAEGKHGMIIAQFGLRLCKNGPLPTELGRALNEAAELRSESDYGATSPDPADVTAYCETAERFVAAVKELLSREG